MRSRFRSCLLLLLFSVLVTSVVSAATYEIPDVVSLAIQKNALLKSQAARSEADLYLSRQAGRVGGPSLDISTGRRKQDQQTGSLFAASVEQPLPLSGRLGLQRSLAELESTATAARLTSAQNDLTLDVVLLSVRCVVESRLVAFVKERQKRFSLLQSFLEGQVFASPQKKAESRIVRNHLRSIVVEGLQTEAAYQTSRGKLQALAPFPEGEPVQIRAPWFLGTRALENKEWSEKALRQNPEILEADIGLKGAELELKLARRLGRPETRVTASYERARAAETETNAAVGVGLDFGSWNRNRFAVRGAERMDESLRKAREAVEWRVTASLPALLAEYEAARLAVLEYPESLLKEQERQLKEAEDGFRKGQIDLLTFLELNDSAADTYRRVLESQAVLIEKAADIFRVSGERTLLDQLPTL